MAYKIVFRNDELRAIIEGRHRRASSVLAKQLRQTIEKLQNDPTRIAHAHRLKHDYAGLWSVRVTGSVRLMYKLCADCLQDPTFRQKNPLPCCQSPDPDPDCINLLEMLDYHE